MSDISNVTEDDYLKALEATIDTLISFLRIGTELGKSQVEMMGLFMGRFQQAAMQA